MMRTVYGQHQDGQRKIWWLAGLSAILLLALMPFSSYVVALPFIRAEWQINNTQSGMIFSSYLVGYALSSLLLVPLTDRIAPRRVLLTGLLLIAGSQLLFPLLARNFWTGALLRFLAGAGHVAVYITGIQLVAKQFADRRGAAVGAFVAAGYAGTTLSYTATGLLMARTESWRSAYFLTALACVAALVLAVLIVPRDNAQPSSSQGHWIRLDLSVLRDPAIALIILAYALHTAELYLARLWFPVLLGVVLLHSGADELTATATAGSLSGLMFMTGIAGVFAGGAFSDMLGRTRGAALIFAISGLCSFLIGPLAGISLALFMAAGFIYGFSTSADSAIYSAAITELAPAERIGSTQAVQSFIGFAIGAVVPVAAGTLLDTAADSTEGWGLVFGFNGLLAVIGVIALLWLRRLPQAARMALGKR